VTETHLVCSACGGVNRVPPGRPATQAKCGRCGRKLFSGHPPDVDAETFDRHVGRTTLPVLVDVWAPWCGPCQAMAPAYAAAARELEPRVALIKLNADAQPAASAKLAVRGIPTMILFHRGREVARSSGAMTAARIVSWVREHLPPAA
jgi:thioredoxin 2